MPLAEICRDIWGCDPIGSSIWCCGLPYVCVGEEKDENTLGPAIQIRKNVQRAILIYLCFFCWLLLWCGSLAVAIAASAQAWAAPTWLIIAAWFAWILINLGGVTIMLAICWKCLPKSSIGVTTVVE
jgi:hypothetical protein